MVCLFLSRVFFSGRVVRPLNSVQKVPLPSVLFFSDGGTDVFQATFLWAMLGILVIIFLSIGDKFLKGLAGCHQTSAELAKPQNYMNTCGEWFFLPGGFFFRPAPPRKLFS